MNTRNKIISAVMAIVMSLSLASLNVFAADYSMTITPSVTEVKAGETFTVAVAIPENPGLNGFLFNLSYDDAFTLTAHADSKLLSGPQIDGKYGNPHAFSWIDFTATENNTATGTLATATFTVSADATPGAYTITAVSDPDNCSSVDFDYYDFGSATTTINVVADAPAGPAYTVATESDVNAAVKGYYTKGFMATVAATEATTIGNIGFEISCAGKEAKASDSWKDISIFANASASFAINVINIPEEVKASDLTIAWDVDGVAYGETTAE